MYSWITAPRAAGHVRRHYGVPAGGLTTSDGGEWQVVDGLEISGATRAGIDPGTSRPSRSDA